MLTILKVRPESSRSIFRYLRAPQMLAEFRSVEGRRYLELTAESRKGKYDMRMIEACVLERSGSILAPKGFSLPEESPLRLFRPSSFSRRMMENLALDLLIGMDAPPAARRLVLYGQEGEMCSFLPDAVMLAGNVRVISDRPEMPEKCAERLRDETGAAVTVTSDRVCGECDLLLAPSGGISAVDCSGAAAVISPDRPDNYRGLYISGAEAAVPPALEDIYCSEYDSQEFIGAFYELANFSVLGGLHPSFAVTDDGRIPPEKIRIA